MTFFDKPSHNFTAPEYKEKLMKSFADVTQASVQKFREECEQIAKRDRRKAIITNTILGAVTVATIVGIVIKTSNIEE